MIDEQEIVDRIIYDIHKGKYTTDEKLPSENEMADDLGLPRITVRKAYKRLQEMGYIYSKQGLGSYVKDRYTQIELVLSGDVSFSEKMKAKGINLISKNIYCSEIEYDEKIFNYLGVSDNERVFKIGRLRYINKRPIALHISYLAKSVFDDIDIEGRNITSMFDFYKSRGYSSFDSKESILSVQFPSAYERRVLECPNLIPLLVIESGCIDKETGRFLEYTKIIYRSDCFTYIVKN